MLSGSGGSSCAVAIEGSGSAGVSRWCVPGWLRHRFWITFEEFIMVQAAASASASSPLGTVVVGVVLCRETHTTDFVSVDGCPYFVVGH